jgi:endonuclease YncB( thermonuclease family)
LAWQALTRTLSKVSRLFRTLIGVLAGCAALTTGLAHGQPGDFAGTITNVVDMAVLEVQPDTGPGLRVQLVGVLPYDAAGQVCGAAAARSHLSDLVSGQTVRVEFDGSEPATDGTGLVHGSMFLADGSNLAELLVRHGEAYRDPTQPPGPLADALGAAQAQAIQDAAGLWAPGACQPADSRGDARLAAFVTDAGQALQEASLAINVLHQQALSARQIGSTPSWQQTTMTAVNWAQHAATRLTQTADAPPVAPELVQLGNDLQAATGDFASAANSPDEMQARATQLDAIRTRVGAASAEVWALARAYDVGD